MSQTTNQNISGTHQWQNKVILITGASAGIGAAMSRVFAQQGAKVAVTARRLERLEALSNELNEQGYDSLAVVCDVTQPDSVLSCVQQVIDHWGHLDVIIANAGFGVAGALTRLTAEDYQRQFDTNVFGVIHTLKAAVPHLKQTQGRAVIVGSVNSYVSLAHNSAYAMSKFAVRALAQSLWSEWAKMGVSLTLANPGFVESEIRKVNNQGVFKENKKDFVPAWLMMPAMKAAQQISKACLKRKREVIITGHGKFIVFLARFFPSLTFQILKRAKRPKLSD